jgi:hypothetical protein
MKLKATKTRLYNLVHEHYSDVPPMRQTEFTKAPRSRSYWLNFKMDGLFCRTYFSAVAGTAELVFENKNMRYVQEIPFSELKKFDLLDTNERNDAHGQAKAGITY